MSTRYPGGFITKNPVAPTSASASGIWTQDQVLQYVRSGTWPQVYVPIYIEDVFSTYLYTGTGSSQTITNNIDTSTKGGLVWIKGRSGATGHRLTDTVRGATKSLASNSTAAEATESTGLTAFGTTGFTIGADEDYNTNTATYVSWTFREQAKFFDVVTWTGNGTGNRTIPHALGSTPGFIQTKRTNGSEDWWNFHRSVTSPNANWWRNYSSLNSTNAFADWGNNSGLYQSPDANNLYIGSYYNNSGYTYVAYLFAHDAGGFGAAGTDNVISCGSYTGNGSATGPTITLGYEPQFLILKAASGGTSGSQDWNMVDNMRGWTVSSNAQLNPNLSAAETQQNNVALTSTGFRVTTAGADFNGNGNTYIYIAIRRGPMKTPTSGTSVFGLSARSGTGANATVTGSAGVSDAVLIKNRGSAVGDLFAARLTGTGYLETSSNAAEVAAGTTILQANPWDVMDGVKVGTTSTITNATSNTYINYLFDRAPGFFDVVCYTGAGAGTVTHGLNVVPEMIICKRRSGAANWAVYHSATGATKYLILNTTTDALTDIGPWNNTAPTSSVFSVGGDFPTSISGSTYVAYLFATVAGVSKVGSYTGTGTTLQVDCGFTAGSRFVMIKRTDSTGDWYVWDSARGIVAGDDPYLLLNSTAAEVTNTDYVDAYSAGFEISSTAPAEINANGGTYIFLAIA